jgi:hypothetical protein
MTASRRVHVAIITASVLAVSAATAPLASGADSSPCGNEQLAPWSSGPVQQCPLFSPLAPKDWIPAYAVPDDWVPVYTVPVARGQGTPVPAPAGWLHGTIDQRFACQEQRPEAPYYHPSDGYRNVWWASTKSDDGVLGWVPEVFFSGGLNDEADGGLRHCSPPTVVPPPAVLPPPSPAPSPLDSDADGDGTPDARDACPGEDARSRDANRNGCLDYLHLQPDVKLDPDHYIKRVGNRYRELGISVHRLTVKGLPIGARIVLSCSRSACQTQRLTVRSEHGVEFKRMRRRKLHSGVRVSLRATLAGAVGAGVTYVILPNDTRKREFCMPPGSLRHGGCSTSR